MTRWPSRCSNREYDFRSPPPSIVAAIDNDLYPFLTTEPNAEVGAIHPKEMLVIVTTPDEVETWMTATEDEVLKLQRPLAYGALRAVARGVKKDPAGLVA